MSLTEHAVLPLPPAVQSQLGLKVPKDHPVLTIDGVLAEAGELELTRPLVRQLWESQHLLGFNIARDPETSTDLRLLRKSVDLFRQTNGRKVCALEWPQIFRLIIPHQKPFVTGKEITLRLHLDHGHVENLVLDGQLTALQKSRPGPGGSWIIARESFELFLKGRPR